MEINKENIFEKFFEGFQAKFIESFKASGEEKILVRILENQKASKEKYRTYFNCAWEFLQTTEIAAQQAKVEELQKRVDKALELMQKPVIVSEPSSYVCERFKELKQALKGEAE